MSEVLAAVVPPAVAQAVPDFTSGEWIAIIGAVGLVITNWRQASKTEKVIQAVVGNGDKRGVVGKLDEIHQASNSTMAAVRAELTISQASNQELRAFIRDLQNERNKKLEVELVAAAKEPGKT